MFPFSEQGQKRYQKKVKSSQKLRINSFHPIPDLHRTANTCDKLLVMFGKAGDFKLALSVVDIMDSSGIPVGNVAHGAVLNALCKAKQIHQAVQYLVNLPQLKCTAIMYSTVLSTLATQKQQKLFDQCLADMESKEIRQDDFIWVQRIRMKYEQNLEALNEEWLAFLASSGNIKDFRPFSAYLVGLAKFGDGKGALAGARELISDFPLEAKDSSPHGICQHHSFVWNAMLGYCLRHRDWETFRSVNALMNKSNFPKNKYTFRNILAIQYYANEPYHQLLSTVESMEKTGVHPDHLANVWLLRCCVRHQRLDLLKVHWSAMLAAGVVPHTRCYNAMIDGAAVTGDVNEAQRVFQSLTRSVCLPDQCTFLALFNCVTASIRNEKRRRRAQRDQNQIITRNSFWGTTYSTLKEWEDQMTSKFKLKFTRASLVALLKAYCKLSSIQDMLRVIDLAKKQDLKLSSIMFNLVISAAAKDGQKTLVFSMLQEMQEKNIKPCVRTFTSLLSLYIHKDHKSASAAWDVISKMEARQMQLVPITQEVLLEACNDRRQLIKYIKWFLDPSNITPQLNIWVLILKKCNLLNCEDLVTEVMNNQQVKTLTQQLERQLSAKGAAAATEEYL
eukprot:g7649.t1